MVKPAGHIESGRSRIRHAETSNPSECFVAPLDRLVAEPKHQQHRREDRTAHHQILERWPAKIAESPSETSGSRQRRAAA